MERPNFEQVSLNPVTVLSWLSFGSLWLTVVIVPVVAGQLRGSTVAALSFAIFVSGYLTYLFTPQASLRVVQTLVVTGNLLPFFGLTTGVWLELYPYLWTDLWALYQYDSPFVLLWTVALLVFVFTLAVMWQVIGLTTYFLTPRLEQVGGSDSMDLYTTPPKLAKPFVTE